MLCLGERGAFDTTLKLDDEEGHKANNRTIENTNNQPSKTEKKS